MTRHTNPSATLSRRALLGAGAGGALAASLPRSAWADAQRTHPSEPGKARNVIFLVSDGMSQGTFTLAEMMRHEKGMGPSHWRTLWNREGTRRATCMTHSADGWVTDSSAAGSAWGCGEHINNGAVNFTPDERTPEPILVTAQKAGKATGLVSTARVTHATPASFIANVPRRSLEDDIAAQMLERKVDVILGGGAKHFPDELLQKHPDLVTARSAQELEIALKQDGRLLGLFRDSHCHYELDRPESMPSLSTMASAALKRLESANGGFVLQIEGGRVDHAAHDNDAAGMIFDQIEFDETIGRVLEWAEGRNDTLIIITTDHATANPGLTYYADKGQRSFSNLTRSAQSFEWITSELKKSNHSSNAAIPIVEAATGIRLTDDEVALFARSAIERQQVDPFNIANGVLMTLGSLLANHTGVAFLSPNHTADYVEVTAVGPGAEAMPSFIDNIDLYPMMLNALGLPVSEQAGG